MIHIDNINAGWASLNIGNFSFYVSYLSELITELDRLFYLLEDDEVNRVILEGESEGDLSLVAYLTFEEVNHYLSISSQRSKDDSHGYIINIVWQNLFSTNMNEFAILRFPYKEFLNDYLKMRNDEEFKQLYLEEFLMPVDEQERQENENVYEEGRKKYEELRAANIS